MSDDEIQTEVETVDVSGVELHNYHTRKASEDGTYVLVTTHSERIEKVPQPLTPEERAQQQKTERVGLMVVGGLGVAFFAFLGVMSWLENRNQRRSPDAGE